VNVGLIPALDGGQPLHHRMIRLHDDFLEHTRAVPLKLRAHQLDVLR
jgi:hypothetical protein